MQPREGVERTLEKVAEWHDHRRPSWPEQRTDSFEHELHELIGAGWPCPHDGFDEVWNAALQDLAARGLRIGRGAFGGWDDADTRLARTAWCLTRHLRPNRVLETGVARGLTTRVLLEALERNGDGHLWSIDLPPLLESELEDETGAAVPDRLGHRWTLRRGSSRRVLAGLLSELGQVDLFLHDSMHTTRNVSFELGRVWPALAPGGAVLIDDVEKNAAMRQFKVRRPRVPALICPSDDRQVLIGCLIKLLT